MVLVRATGLGSGLGLKGLRTPPLYFMDQKNFTDKNNILSFLNLFLFSTLNTLVLCVLFRLVGWGGGATFLDTAVNRRTRRERGARGRVHDAGGAPQIRAPPGIRSRPRQVRETETQTDRQRSGSLCVRERERKSDGRTNREKNERKRVFVLIHPLPGYQPQT